MSEAKHTPGPWKEGDYILWPARGGDAQFPVHAKKRGRIALALNKQADARLIAAAPDLLAGLRWAVNQIDAEICTHEEVHRGGAIWTICSGCGMKWADDRGGFKPYSEPPELTAARAAITKATGA